MIKTKDVERFLTQRLKRITSLPQGLIDYMMNIDYVHYQSYEYLLGLSWLHGRAFPCIYRRTKKTTIVECIEYYEGEIIEDILIDVEWYSKNHKLLIKQYPHEIHRKYPQMMMAPIKIELKTEKTDSRVSQGCWKMNEKSGKYSAISFTSGADARRLLQRFNEYEE